MTKKINPELLSKIEKLKQKYQKVTSFSEALPLFSKRIIEDEIDGTNYCTLANSYGKLYCAWGINWYTNTPTNYPQEKHSEAGFVNVYINTYSLFGDDCSGLAHQELAKVLPSIKVHFFDSWNTSFYFLPSEAEAGLKQLEAWFVDTKAQCDSYLKKKRKEKLEQELKELS